jgi:hypothetical protein
MIRAAFIDLRPARSSCCRKDRALVVRYARTLLSQKSLPLDCSVSSGSMMYSTALWSHARMHERQARFGRSRWRGVIGLCIVLAAFNGRTVFSSNAAVLPAIIAELHVSRWLSSSLTALPILCMGVFAPFSARLAPRHGAENTLLLAVFILSIALVSRSAGGIVALFVGTGLAGASISAINVVLPVLVKRHYPSRAPLMTGLRERGISARHLPATNDRCIWPGKSIASALRTPSTFLDATLVFRQ